MQVTCIRFSQYFFLAPCNRNNSARTGYDITKILGFQGEGREGR
jgi:hypothetical protein